MNILAFVLWLGLLPQAHKPFAALPQAGNVCAPALHCTTLNWTNPNTACVAPACTIAWNVFRGTAAGAESTTPINASPVSATTYTDPVTLTGSVQTFFYTIQAVETVGTVTATSAMSNEVSDSFPAVPQAAVLAVPVPH